MYVCIVCVSVYVCVYLAHSRDRKVSPHAACTYLWCVCVCVCVYVAHSHDRKVSPHAACTYVWCVCVFMCACMWLILMIER